MTQHKNGNPPVHNFTASLTQSPIGNDHSEGDLYMFLEMRYGAGYAQNIVDNLRRFKTTANDQAPTAEKPAMSGK